MMVIVLKNDSLLWDPSSKRFVHPHLVMYTVLFATAFTRINGSFTGSSTDSCDHPLSPVSTSK